MSDFNYKGNAAESKILSSYLTAIGQIKRI